MALVTLLPTAPDIAQDVTDIPLGTASGFATALNARKSTLRDRDKQIQARLEKLCDLLGNGWISGGAISAGVGLSVSVGALEAVCGAYLEIDAAQTVGGLIANLVNYLWLRQDGTFTTNTTGATPSTTDGKGAALLWGTATTNASAVTAVNNERASAGSGTPGVPDRIAHGATATLRNAQQLIIAEQMLCYGILSCYGTLYVR